MIEELYKCSEKELKEKLENKTVYNSKYLIPSDILPEKISNENVLQNCTIFKGWMSYNQNGYDDVILRLSNINIENLKPLSFKSFMQLKLNNIYNITDRVSFSSIFKFLVKKTVDIYGEENVDYEGPFESSYGFITIYLGDIIIRNSVEQKHLLRETYVKLLIHKHDGIKLYDLKRTAYLPEEIQSNYIFSHVNTHSFKSDYRNGTFCFGYNNPVTEMMASIQNLNVGIRKFTLFLLLLKEYLSWESIEGTPYYHIDRVLSKISKYTRAPTPVYNINTLFSYILQNITNFKYTFILDNVNYSIKISEESLEEIDNLLTAQYPEYCYIRSENNTSVIKNPDIKSCSYEGAIAIIFKGEEKKIKIVNSKNLLPKKIHTVILKEIVNKLENTFEQFLLEKRYE